MNKKYPAQELVDNADKIADKILKTSSKNKYRDLFFPLLINELDLKFGAEIGVDKAEFSEKLLTRSNLENLYCIDNWMDDFGSGYQPDRFDKSGNNRRDQAVERLMKTGKSFITIKKNSVDACKDFKDDSLDFCYLDGDHSLFGIYEDIFSWTKKIKIGGIVSGHDYKEDGGGSGIKDYFGGQLPYRVKSVVEDYCQKYGHKLNVIGGFHKNWWFVKNI